MIKEIESLMLKKEEPNVVGNIFFNLMTNCNQSYESLMNMPIPMAMCLLKIIEKQNKEQEKLNKKRK